jgi:hypothetical protein
LYGAARRAAVLQSSPWATTDRRVKYWNTITLKICGEQSANVLPTVPLEHKIGQLSAR